MRNLELGESGDVSVTAQYKNSARRWVAAPKSQKATRWKARVYVRGHDGVRQELVRFGRTRREAEASLEAAVSAVLRGADAIINPTMPLLEAGEHWLKQIARPDSGLSARTIADYSWTWQKYVDSMTSSRSLRVMARVWSRSFDLAAVEVTVRTWRVASLDSTPLSTA